MNRAGKSKRAPQAPQAPQDGEVFETRENNSLALINICSALGMVVVGEVVVSVVMAMSRARSKEVRGTHAHNLRGSVDSNRQTQIHKPSTKYNLFCPWVKKTWCFDNSQLRRNCWYMFYPWVECTIRYARYTRYTRCERTPYRTSAIHTDYGGGAHDSPLPAVPGTRCAHQAPPSDTARVGASEQLFHLYHFYHTIPYHTRYIPHTHALRYINTQTHTY